MAEWTMDDVAARFSEAAETGRRLPPVRVQGYFNVWPAFARVHRPDDGGHALGTMAGGQRHLIWMRAKQREWKDICRRIGCDRTTAWRRWQRALGMVAARLNEKSLPKFGKHPNVTP